MAWRGNSDQTSQKPLASHMSRICVAKSEAFYTVDAEIVYPYWKKIPFRKETRLMLVWDLFVHHCIIGKFDSSTALKNQSTWKKKDHPPKGPNTYTFIGVSHPFVNFGLLCVYLRIFCSPWPFVKRVIRMNLGASQVSQHLTLARLHHQWVTDPFQPRQRVEDALSSAEVDMAGSWMRFP